jgi:hypothetical protein
MIMGADDNELARKLRHEGIRVGEIIACRAWLVIKPGWLRRGDDRLHSVYRRDYVWHPDKPASGDVRTHGIYSFRDAARAKYEYISTSVDDGPLLLGKVKIWGEVVEHEVGYRSQFGKIVSLDDGDPELLEKFRNIYHVNQVNAEPSASASPQR